MMRELLARILVVGLLVAGLGGPARAQPTLVARIEHLELAPLRGNPADSLFLALQRQYNHAVSAHDEARAAAHLQRMGEVCYRLGHYPQAFDYYRQAGQLFGRLRQLEALAHNFNALGALYYANKQPGPARQQYNQALGLFRRVANAHGMADTYGKIGYLCEKQQRYDSAFYYQRRALHQYQALDNPRGKAKICENLGSIFEDFARYDSARYYFRQALALSRQAGDDIAQIEVLNNLGDVLRKTGQYGPALRETRRALALALRTGEHHQVGGAYGDLAKTFSLLGRNDSAYYYSAWSRKYQVATYSAANNQQLALLQTLYHLNRKDQEIARLSNARTVNQLLLAAGAGAAVLLVLLASVVISRQRLKIRSAHALADQNQRMYDTQRELMQVELRNKQLEEESLKRELATKDRELTTNTLHVIQKNQLLRELRGQLDDLVKEDRRDQKKQLKQLLHQISENFNHDQHWEEFRTTFEQMHQPFFARLRQRCDSLTAGENRLVALLKMNLPSQDIAASLGVSVDSLRVMRYRLRKRLNLAQGESLTAFLQAL